LLPVPEVEEEQEEDESEGVDGHGAVVQERKEFAHDVTRVPFHHVDSLISIKAMMFSIDLNRLFKILNYHCFSAMKISFKIFIQNVKNRLIESKVKFLMKC
jgi:hypothetical protein